MYHNKSCKMSFIRSIIRLLIISCRLFILRRLYKIDISKTARISFRAKLDKTKPKLIHIGDESYIASGAIIFSHDFSRKLYKDTYVGKRCFIGANAIVMCGVRIGDEVVVGSGAIVTKDVPSHCIVAGNPARIIKKGIRTQKFGQIKLYQENSDE